ncbi:prealbumin-like fold domain-containing protein [Bacillus thuringiensis]
MKQQVRFLSLFVLAATLMFSGDMFTTTVQAFNEKSILAKNRSHQGTGILEIKLVALDWGYSKERPGKFEYSIGKVLTDVEFTIYKDEQVYTKQRTDKDGKVYFQLPLGTYTYKQTSLHPHETDPKGSYARQPGIFPITIAFNGESHQRITYNSYSWYGANDTCILHDEIMNGECK